ncbi:MAG: PEGA domain-containing protein [Prevotellaceae bacterium]|jgi:hypothetical protein|nr:PEGA domain-containing protein [Prevotellaceae bacterium]
MVNFLQQKIIIIPFLLISLAATAQQLTVESFSMDEDDTTARTINSLKDSNGKVCAIVKVETPLLLQDFTFNTGATGVVRTEQKTGEIWVYFSPGTAQITLEHKSLGEACSHKFGETLKEATVYTMKLKLEDVKALVKDSATLQYMEALCEAEGATISIDGAMPEPFIGGKFTKQLSYGQRRYTVEAPMHYPESGVVELTAQASKPLVAKLKPKFGKLIINTQPEQGADVFIDGVKRGQSPLVIERIDSGVHKIRAEKAQILSTTQEKNIAEGATETITLNVSANAPRITIIARSGADIYVNDEKKEAARWSGNLSPGRYKVEARKPAHRSSVVTLVSKIGENQTISLVAPTPMYGSLNVKTGKVRAVVFVDGKKYGTTPTTVKNILVGTRNIELQADGYQPYKQTVEIQERKILPMDVVLPRKDSTGTLVITANTKTKISLNGAEKGSTPITVDSLPLIRTEILFMADGYRPLMGIGTVAPGKTFVYGGLDLIPVALLSYIMSPPTSYLGFSVGYCKKFGGYLQYRADWEMEEKANLARINEDFTSGQRKYFRSSVTAGGTLRIFNFMWVYAGLGYGKYGAVYQVGENRVIYTAGLLKGLELEYGATFRLWKMFSASIGYSTIARSNFGELHFGIGLIIPTQKNSLNQE